MSYMCLLFFFLIHVLTTNNSLFFDTDTSFSGDSVSKNLGEFSNNNVEDKYSKKNLQSYQYNKQRLERDVKKKKNVDII